MDEPTTSGGQRRATRAFQIAKSTVEHFLNGGTDRAAAMAYYAVLSIFPAVLIVVLISLLLSSTETVTETVDWAVDRGLDPDIGVALNQILQTAVERASSGVGFAVLVAAVFAVSGASGWLAAAGRAIEPDPERRHQRNPVTGRIRYSLWTVFLISLIVAALALLSIGGEAADTVFTWLGAETGAPWFWDVLRPVLLMLGIVTAMLVLYRVAPDRVTSPPWRALLPGAVLAGIGWVLASAGFSFYVTNIGRIGATYGAFATPIVLLIWLWLSGVVVLIGAELNAELTRRREGPHGPLRLEGADDPAIAGHPAGAYPDPSDDAALQGRD